MELHKRGVDLDSILFPCFVDGIELVDHNLVLCKEASSIWERIYQWYVEANWSGY